MWSNVLVIKINALNTEYEIWYILLRDRACIWPAAVGNPIHQWKFRYSLSVEITCFLSLPYDSLKRTLISIRYQHWKCRLQSWECWIILSYIKRGMSIRPSGDTAGGFVFDDFVDKQVVHVRANSFRSGAERVSMVLTHRGKMAKWPEAAF